MEVPNWPREFEAIVSSHLTKSPEPGALDPDLDLPAAGIDSVTTIGLMIDLEEKLLITLPDDLLTAHTFSTPARLWAAVRACLPSNH